MEVRSCALLLGRESAKLGCGHPDEILEKVDEKTCWIAVVAGIARAPKIAAYGMRRAFMCIIERLAHSIDE